LIIRHFIPTFGEIVVMKPSSPHTAALREIDFIRLLGGKAILKKAIRSNFDLIALSDNGLTKASLESLIGHLGVSKKSFLEDILDLSIKTLERKKSTEKLDRRTSSHVIDIAKVVEHAFGVFEDKEKVKRWLTKPNAALNNMKPFDLFSTSTGIGMVNDILGRIEEGVYS
jgi:putative toxin-antitoxin system antitoxin component (TIGR02293 family)